MNAETPGGLTGGSEKVIAATNPSIARRNDNRPRYCRFTERVSRRRKVSRALDDQLRELYPQPPREPETFGLSEDELRAHANALHSAGWPVREICEVLDVEPPGAA
jgi:hypothetical protein